MAWNEIWDDVYQKNAWGRYPPEEVVRFVARNFYSAPNRKDVRILEVGCGPATNLWYLAREGFSAFGLDGSAVAIEQARRRLAEESVAAELKVGDAVHLPYPDASFDGVLDIECIYANAPDDAKRIIAEVHRVLKPEGRFFSKTFMAAASDKDNPLPANRGVVRLTEEKEIPALYGVFGSIEYDYLIRSEKNRRHQIKEWLITCRK